MALENDKFIKKIKIYENENKEMSDEISDIQNQISAQLIAIREFNENIQRLKKKKRFFGCF